MLKLIVGENTFEIERYINQLTGSFVGQVEKFDGSQIELINLPNIMMGSNLFSESRLVIIKDLSDNKSIWLDFSVWLSRLSDDVELVLVETKPDKRTVTYKDIKSNAKIMEFPIWSERDVVKAEPWVEDESKVRGVNLSKKLIQYLTHRVGVNQWDLSKALDKLALVDDIDVAKIDNVIDANPSENVFNVLETALSGNQAELSSLLSVLKKTEDPFKLFSLLSSQTFQLAVMSNVESSDNPAKDFGIHPFVVGKLRSLATKLGKNNIKKTVNIVSQADDDMKLSVAEPWVLIERALIKLATI